MSILKMQGRMDLLEERLAAMEKVVAAVEADLRESWQGEFFDRDALRVDHTLVALGLKPPEPTALPDPDEDDTPFE